jgi:hypothetical protein
MKKLIIILILMSLITGSVSAYTNTIYWGTANADAMGYANTTQIHLAQGFYANETFDLKNITVRFRYNPVINVNVTLAIYNDNSGFPGNIITGFANIILPTFGAGDVSRTFIFPTGTTLTTGNNYYIVAYANSIDQVQIHQSGGEVYSGGYKYYNTSSSSWVSNSPIDLAMIIEGGIPPCIESWSPQYTNSSCNGTSINELKTYEDLNTCNTTTSLPGDNGTISNTYSCTPPIPPTPATPKIYYQDDFNDNRFMDRWTCDAGASITHNTTGGTLIISVTVNNRGCSYRQPNLINDTNVQVFIRMKQNIAGYFIRTEYLKWNSSLTAYRTGDCYGGGSWLNPGGGGWQAYFSNCTHRLTNYYSPITGNTYYNQTISINQDTNMVVDYSVLSPYPALATSIPFAKQIRPFGMFTIVTESQPVVIDKVCIANNISDCDYILPSLTPPTVPDNSVLTFAITIFLLIALVVIIVGNKIEGQGKELLYAVIVIVLIIMAIMYFLSLWDTVL